MSRKQKKLVRWYKLKQKLLYNKSAKYYYNGKSAGNSLTRLALIDYRLKYR
nr:MAG TPA: hypothetical protein [Caudoviricetes sp.]